MGIWGFWGIGLLLIPPLYSIDMIEYDLMDEDLVLFQRFSIIFVLYFGYMNQGYFGGRGPKMCVTKVWGVLGGKPWFYTFWGFGACFGVWFV
jgi:hypothetical protein